MMRPIVRQVVRTGMICAFAATSLGSMGCAPSAEGTSGIETTRRNFVYDDGIFVGNGLKMGSGLTMRNGSTITNGIDFSTGVDPGNGINLASDADLDGWNVPHFNADAGADLYAFLQDDAVMNERILKYLVECALPYGQEVAMKKDGYARTLAYGKAGLGTSIQYGVMNQAEQESVTACMLARVNAKGEIVQFNEFGPFSGFTDASPEEMQMYPVGEYTFYGNLFVDPPQAFMTYGGKTFRSECTTRACMRADGSCDCGIVQNVVNGACTRNTIGGTSSSYYTDCSGNDGNSYHNTISARVARKGAGEPCSLNYQCASRSCSVNDGASYGTCD